MADLYDLGERPPVGEIPKRMHAYVVRQNRFGPPRDAWRREVIPTPTIRPDEVLIYVMASGINYNNVWAALGAPLDVIGERQKAGEPEDFHAGGSDCSGIVWAIGRDVKHVKVGDEVVIHSGWWRPDDPWVRSGKDPMLAESTRIWGYQTNYGSYCQFARCQAHQCVPKPKRLTWEEAGCFLLCASTAYRMLMGWAAPRRRARRRRARVGSGGWPREHGARDHPRTRRPSGGGRFRRGEAEVLPRPRRHGGRQPQPVLALGSPARHEGRPRLRRVGERRPRVRQGDVGRAGRARQSPDRFRASRRGDAADLGLRLRDRRHGRHLRRHDRLQRHARPSLSLDAPEALPRKPPVQ